MSSEKRKIAYIDGKPYEIGANHTSILKFVKSYVGEKKVPIMEKRQRTKDGPLGKLQTVYKWTPEFQQLIKDNQ